MIKKLTKNEYFDRCKKIHNNYYDYSISEFIGVSKKIKIICPEHGIFEQRSDNHMNGQKCIYCSNKKWNTNKFIKQSNEIHNNKYDYSLTIYKNAHTKIKIKCPEHGIFDQIPWNHLNGEGCPFCAVRKTTLEIFKSKSNRKHNNKYNYSLITEYTNCKTKIKIICPEHGIFEQISNNHLNGEGCPYCYTKNKTTLENFKNKSNQKHNNKYNYSLITEYINTNTKVKIICSKHGYFYQLPRNHLFGQGCPKCNESKGEKLIREFLEKNLINFIQYKRFKNCKYKNLLSFDFYLQEQNICIEFDGIQHFKNWFNDDNDDLKNRIEKDEIKNKYCSDNNIKLIRIKYSNIKNINSILRKEIISK